MNQINDSVQLTAEGHDQLMVELTDLKEMKLPAAIQRVATARSFGDLSENAEYQASREDLSFLEGRVAEIEAILAKATILKPNGKKPSRSVVGLVDLGSIVTVKNGRSTQKYHIVGEWEADPKEMKISHQSPLGKALIGKTRGEAVEIDVPAGKVKYTIVTIE